MISQIMNDCIFTITSLLPYKSIRYIRRNGKKIKKVYYGNFNELNIDFYYALRRLI